jgi:shikimate dehydrogenase
MEPKQLRLAGVMAWPVSHSLSPRLHGYWLSQYGINGSYLPLSVPPSHFSRALKNLPNTLFVGVNVTLPYKETALAVVDVADDTARRMGAVNTVIVKADGTLFGTNTDGYGFLENMRDVILGWRADTGPAVVLGAGGASRGVCVALLDEGIPEIRLVNRTGTRARILATELSRSITTVPWSDRESALEGARLLVNATSLGMTGKDELDLTLDKLPVEAVVYDIVYTPTETQLLVAAKARGNAVVDGLGMLLHQASPGFQAWFGTKPDVNVELRNFMSENL